MTNENMKIMNWKNGLLLSTVSFMLYLILWFILDDETAGQLPEMTVADYIIDYLFCMLFTYISLGFSFLVFRILPFRTSLCVGDCLCFLPFYPEQRCRIRHDFFVQFPMG